MLYYIKEFFRWLAIFTCLPFQFLLFKRRTFYAEGVEKRPWLKGGAVVISNHYNFLDYLMMMHAVLPRKLNVVASEFAFANPILTFGCSFFGVIKADRPSKSMKFVDEAADVARRGQLVEIFPEGRNTPDGKIGPFKESYILIAYRSGTPIIPVITDGNYGFFRRASIIVGEPINVRDYIADGYHTPPREDLRRVNEMIRNRCLELQAELEERKKGGKAK